MTADLETALHRAVELLQANMEQVQGNIESIERKIDLYRSTSSKAIQLLVERDANDYQRYQRDMLVIKIGLGYCVFVTTAAVLIWIGSRFF